MFRPVPPQRTHAGENGRKIFHGRVYGSTQKGRTHIVDSESIMFAPGAIGHGKIFGHHFKTHHTTRGEKSPLTLEKVWGERHHLPDLRILIGDNQKHVCRYAKEKHLYGRLLKSKPGDKLISLN